MIDLSNLRLSFGGRDIFQDVSLRVEDNERVALFGINGAGKSTLLKVISGQQKPDAGEVALGRGEVVGYLAQEAAEDTSDSEATVFDYACRAFEELAEGILGKGFSCLTWRGMAKTRVNPQSAFRAIRVTSARQR